MALSPLAPALGVEPVLISTSAGVVGAVVTLPPGQERGAVAILPGKGSTRAGVNQVWAKLASSLAVVGVCSIRLDYPGTGESHLCRTDLWEEGTAETIDWFRHRTRDQRLVLVAECGGLFLAHREVIRDPARVSGVGLVMPLPVLMAGPMQVYRRTRAVAHSVKHFAGCLGYRQARRPKPDRWPREVLLALGHANEMLFEIASRVPLWIMTVRGDPSSSELLALNKRFPKGVSFELELAAPAWQSCSDSPGEREIVACTTAWISRHLGFAVAPGLPSGLPEPTTRGDLARDRRAALMKTEKRIARFIESELTDGAGLNVDPLANGMLDSLALEALVAWIEERFEIPLRDEDLVPENFASVAALAAFVDTRRGGARSGPT